jgi:hypothetical protein
MPVGIATLRLDDIIPVVVHTQDVDTRVVVEAAMAAAVDTLAVVEDMPAPIAVALTVAAVLVEEATGSQP